MITLQSLALLMALASPGQAVLLDFYADSCSACESMEPTIRRLISEGHPVRRINVQHEPQMTRRYRVDRVPTYIVAVDGQPVDRVVGPASYERLRQMLGQAGSQAGDATQTNGSHQETPSRPLPTADRQTDSDPQRRALEATVRLRIEDRTGSSYGTGTIIDAQESEALVITCGHLFRECSGQGKISVDLFAPGAQNPVPGKLLAYDLEKDVALVAIWPGMRVRPVRVAPANHSIQAGDRVFSIGCDRGNDPTVWPSHITSLNKFLGPANIQVAGQPVIGRSGGGLFSSDGQLIGVCNAADPRDDEGLYAALPVLHQHLAANLPATVLEQNMQLALGGPGEQPRTSEPSPPPNMPEQMPRTPPQERPDVAQPTPLQPVPPGTAPQPKTTPASLAAWIENAGEDTEVICIVRSKSDPHDTGALLVFDRPSRELLDYLTANQRPREPEPHHIATDPPASTPSPQPPDRSDGSLNTTPILRGQSTPGSPQTLRY